MANPGSPYYKRVSRVFSFRRRLRLFLFTKVIVQNSIELNKSSWPFPKLKFQPSGQRFQHQSGVLSLLGLAIDILRRRITHRYLKPVGVLVNAETKIAAAERRFGFTILAIDCLFLETLQAFRMGLPNTKGKSKIIFQRFLTTHDRFSRYFDIVQFSRHRNSPDGA